MKKRIRREDGISRGIYVLPNLITSGSLCAGFYSIASTYNGQFERAAVAIIVAVVLDGLDGRLARMTRTTVELARVEKVVLLQLTNTFQKRK